MIQTARDKIEQIHFLIVDKRVQVAKLTVELIFVQSLQYIYIYIGLKVTRL